MGKIGDPEAARAILSALAYVLGGKPDDYHNVIVVYETGNDMAGATSFTCCPEHTLRLLAMAQLVVIEDPAQPFGAACTG